MCLNCWRQPFLGSLYDEELIFGGGGGRRFGGLFDIGDGIDRDSFAPVSRRAMNALDNAKRIFIQHLATVDTSNGPVTTEIIKFHLVPDMRKAFNKYVKENGCTAIPRQLTREEQQIVNKTRKSLMWYTSVKVTPEAQRQYLQKNPEIAAKHAAHTKHNDQAPVASCSGTASTSEGLTTQVPKPQPLRDVTDVEAQKIKHKLNQAAVNRAATNPSIKKLHAQNSKA